ncbi:MAG: DUF4160 domain-containing protein [Pseudomonadota bacterium]|jgi:hypothetical protein|nr:DUF4160 domain-containing protein [Pseudomonadota bacterium]
MPVVFRHKNVRFFFFSNEGNPREPIHIHADAPDGDAKFWLYPEVQVARSAGFDRRTLAELARVVEDHRDEIERAWHEHFG